MGFLGFTQFLLPNAYCQRAVVRRLDGDIDD